MYNVIDAGAYTLLQEPLQFRRRCGRKLEKMLTCANWLQPAAERRQARVMEHPGRLHHC
jgi:hypothetical protein